MIAIKGTTNSATLEILVGIVLIMLAYHELDVRVWMGVAMGLVGVVNFWTTMYTVRVRKNTHHILLAFNDAEKKS